MNLNDLNHDLKSEHTRHSVWERLSRWARHMIQRLDLPPVAGNEIYMRWPGERVPTMAESGPQWPMRRQDDWVLAA